MIAAHRIHIYTVWCMLVFAGVTDANFTIDYDNNSFSLNGKPFRYVSGSAHYFRMPHQYWRDRLRKMKAGGLNAVSTYVEWSQHERTPGVYDFSGGLNLVKFIRIAQEEGLYVILRPGPYICAERDMGGLPFWLLHENPDVKLRTNDPKFTKYVEKWMNVLFGEVAPLLIGNGGPIILVQVENEYGYYHACDHKYNLFLRDLFLKHVKNNAVLFTTDPPANRALGCGKIPGVYATVDFGPHFSAEKSFSFQRKWEPRGPLVNSEYYAGWFTHWGEKAARKGTSFVVDKLKDMLSMGANVNIYMYFGGTNFGFTAGANEFLKYQSDITSYDYDAPISEAGDLTEKYFAIRDAIAEYMPPEKNVTVKTHDKGDYGTLMLKNRATIMSPYVRSTLGRFHQSRYPLTFEQLNHNTGYVLYETDLRKNISTPTDYFIESFADYANVYLDGKYMTNLSREYNQHEFRLNRSKSGQVLGIMVENLGRVNSGWILNGKKGIASNVTRNSMPLNKWNMTGFEMTSVTPIEKCFNADLKDCNNGQGFFIYSTQFLVSPDAGRGIDGNLLDAFLDVTTLTKGIVFVNDHNLGRYWSRRGPQYTLYVPGVYLRPYPQDNTLVIVDEGLRNATIRVSFSKKPIFEY